jgi:hypothetical protein
VKRAPIKFPMREWFSLRIPKCAIAVSLGCSAISDHTDMHFHGGIFTLPDQTHLIRFSALIEKL